MKRLLKILPLALIFCFMVGCQEKESVAELEALRAQTEVEKQNKALVEHLFKELNKGNAEIIEELYAVDSSSFSPSASLKPISREEATEITKEFFHAFPDLTHNLEESIAAEDKVIIRFTAQGTHEGEFLGIPATGKKIFLVQSQYCALRMAR